MSPTVGTFDQVISGHAAREPDAPAIVMADGSVITHGRLARFITEMASALRAEGLAAWRVGTILRGEASALMPLAVPAVAVCAPMNPSLSLGDLKHYAAAVQLDALIVTEDSELLGKQLAAALDLDLVLLKPAAGEPSLFQLQRLAVRRGPPPEPRTDGEIAFLLRSSGTTGTPKIVPVTHRNVRALPVAMTELFGMTASDRSAGTMPLYYAAGLGQTLLTAILLGGSICLPTKAERHDVSAWLGRLQPTWLSSSPATLRALLDRLDPADELPLPGIKFVICGGSLVPEPLRMEAETRLRTPVLTTYGLTEAGVVAANPPSAAARRSGTVGLTLPGLLTIRDEAGREASRGVAGSIHVRGEVVTPGYLDHEPLGDDWLATGDLGIMDEDGYLTITGRIKEMINRGGEKISPYDIEAAALEHPAVIEAAAFGVPHPLLGESPALAVVLRPDQTISPSELRELLAGQLAPFKTPRSIYIRSDLPRGPTGKVRRDRLPGLCRALNKEIAQPTEALEYQLLEIWEELLGRSDIGVEDDFFEAGGDSLLAERMLLEVETLVRRSISSAELGPVMTIRGLSQTLSHAAAQEWSLITCARQGMGAPFYFCHGDIDTRGFYALKLADLMAIERPVHLIHPAFENYGGDGIREMAADCVEQMVAEQPSGSFDVGGYCNGGLLAWEIANQLIARGRQVDRVILLDSVSLNFRPAVRAAAWFAKRLPAYDRLRGGPDSWMKAVWWVVIHHTDFASSVRRVRRVLAARWFNGPKPYSDRSKKFEHVSQVMADYVPPKLDVRLYCLTGAESARLREFSTDVWRKFDRRASATVLPGGHQTVITTHARVLAATMRNILKGSLSSALV